MYVKIPLLNPRSWDGYTTVIVVQLMNTKKKKNTVIITYRTLMIGNMFITKWPLVGPIWNLTIII